MMNVYLIRHTSVAVPQGTCYGQSDVPVKDSFEEEATAVLRQIKDIRFDKVYCSPLSRCVKLAAYCGYPNAEREERIKEIDFGDWEMKKYDEIEDPRLQECDQWGIVYRPISSREPLFERIEAEGLPERCALHAWRRADRRSGVRPPFYV